MLVFGDVHILKRDVSKLNKIRLHPRRKVIFQPSVFRGELLNFQGVPCFYDNSDTQQPIKSHGPPMAWPQLWTPTIDNVAKVVQVRHLTFKCCVKDERNFTRNLYLDLRVWVSKGVNENHLLGCLVDNFSKTLPRDPGSPSENGNGT